jgi:RasGEF domain
MRALQCPHIAKLKITWKSLPKHLFGVFEDMKELVQETDDYALFRKKMEGAGHPQIPVLGRSASIAPLREFSSFSTSGSHRFLCVCMCVCICMCMCDWFCVCVCVFVCVGLVMFVCLCNCVRVLCMYVCT